MRNINLKYSESNIFQVIILPSVGLLAISRDHNKLFEIGPRQINPKRHNDMPSPRNSEMLSTKKIKQNYKSKVWIFFIFNHNKMLFII